MSREAIADAIEALALLFHREGSLRRALLAWPSSAPEELRRPFERLAGRVALGAPLSYTLSDLRTCLGAEEQVLVGIVKLHLASGADPVAPLRAQARRLRADEELRRRCGAGLAGVRASARLIASLPIACLLLLPAERSPLQDLLGLALAAGGLALTTAGFVWIRRSIPVVSVADPIAGACDLMAGAVSAGVTPVAAFELSVTAATGRERAAMERAVRLVRLGSRLSRALELADAPGLGELGRLIDRSTSSGMPLGPALEDHARARRAAAAAAAEAAIRRAPVRMLPALALCVLPAFVLLGLGPFVRDVFRLL